MGRFDELIGEIASDQRFLVTRADVLEIGGSKSLVDTRIGRGSWARIHEGVYQTDRRPQTWEDRLLAAVFACGPGAVASHRAALVLWNLDGISTAPVEVTMPFGNLAFPERTVVHRTRRPPVPVAHVRCVPVTSVERTLLDCARFLGDRLIGKALDSALRQRLTTIEDAYRTLAEDGGRGVTGTRRFRRVLANRMYDQTTDSGAEYDILYAMQMAGLPLPELDHELFPRGGRRIPDFYWPKLLKAVEIDGIDAHSSADRLDDDLDRQNAIMDLGIEIRRFSARRVRRDPSGVVAEVKRFLDA